MQIYIPNSPFSLKPRPEIKEGCAIRRVILPIWNEPERRRSPGAAVQEPMRAQQKKNQGRDKATSCCSGATKYSKGRIVHLQGMYSANSFFNGAGV